MSNLSRRAIRNRTSRVQRQNDSAVLSYLLVVVRLRYFIRTQRISCALSQPKVIKKLGFLKVKTKFEKTSMVIYNISMINGSIPNGQINFRTEA